MIPDDDDDDDSVFFNEIQTCWPAQLNNQHH